jgi:DNA-binding transcriptional LysR family regulator
MPSHFVQPYIEQELLVRKDVLDIPMNDSCYLAWNKKVMGNGVKWVLDWLGEESWLNKVWLQNDTSKPLGYHIP